MKKVINKKQVQRRNFLKTSAAVGTASSLGLTLVTQKALANNDSSNNSKIKRIVFVYVPFGAFPKTHLFKDGTLGEGCEPLIEHQKNIVFFESCDANTYHYKIDGLLGLKEGGKTLDVALGETFGANSMIASLHLGVETYEQSISQTDSKMVEYQNNPVTAFNKIFTGLDNNLTDYNQKIAPLKHNLNELKTLKSTLKNDQQKINQIENFEHSINKKIELLNNSAYALCNIDSQETYNWDENITNNFTIISNMHCDTIVKAFECNLTNVATLQLAHANGPEAPAPAELNGPSMYEASHYGRDHYLDYTRYTNSRLAYLIDRLKNTTDMDGLPLFDSTLLFKVTCDGDSYAHDNYNAAFMMAGGSEILEGGRNIIADDNYDLLDTITEELGLTGQVPKYGNKKIKTLFK